MESEPNAPQAEASPPEDAPQAILSGAAAERVKRYARLVSGAAVAVGAFVIAGAAMIREGVSSGETQNYVVGGLLVVFGIGQGINAWTRYRQLDRYLRTGSGSKYEDLIRAVEKGGRRPEG